MATRPVSTFSGTVSFLPALPADPLVLRQKAEAAPRKAGPTAIRCRSSNCSAR